MSGGKRQRVTMNWQFAKPAPSLSNPHIEASVIGQYLGFGFGFGFPRVGVAGLFKSHSTLDNP